MSIEAIKHYEAALKEAFPRGATGDVFHHWNEARKAIEQAEQAQSVAEKVGRITANVKDMVLRQEVMLYTDDYLPIGTALYTAPPPRQPLTDEERFQAFARADKKMMINGHRIWRDAIADEIEAAIAKHSKEQA